MNFLVIFILPQTLVAIQRMKSFHCLHKNGGMALYPDVLEEILGKGREAELHMFDFYSEI